MAAAAILTLVRHGETGANLDGVWHGSTDTPLTERGRAQAGRVAAYLREQHGDAAALYSSHLQRARHTAEAIAAALSLEICIEEALGEYDLGSWEGKTYKELLETHRFWHQIKNDPDFAPHGGESPRQVAERLAGALRLIGNRHPGERVIVVTHGGALSMALAQLLKGDYTEWTAVMENCAVSELAVGPEAELLSFNRAEHLMGL